MSRIPSQRKLYISLALALAVAASGVRVSVVAVGGGEQLLLLHAGALADAQGNVTAWWEWFGQLGFRARLQV